MSKLHRFYVSREIAALENTVSIKNDHLVNQWSRVLRYKVGDELVLFDGVGIERTYVIEEFGRDVVRLRFVADVACHVPKKSMTLYFSLMKKDKNEWVMQKCTELGVSHFVPIIADRSEKLGFDIARAQRIILEASEQCGRSDIPTVCEPMTIESALQTSQDSIVFWAEQTLEDEQVKDADHSFGIFVGPEGGWSESEKERFSSSRVKRYSGGVFVLRAETACVAVCAQLLV